MNKTFTEFAADTLISEADERQIAYLKSAEDGALAESVFGEIKRLGATFAKANGHCVIRPMFYNDAEQVVIKIKERLST